jgi:multidrug efflux pump subunit AcrA (membrane-fusion protein)
MIASSDGLARQRPVKVGIRNGDDVQILEGVASNEKVVTSGAYGLPDKAKIKTEAAEAPDQGARPTAGGSKTPSEGAGDK